MTAQHTPGPWTWAEDHPQNACVSIYAHADWGYHGVATLYTAPNDTDFQNTNGVWSDAPKRRANARLIAAAPDLLASLEEAADPINGYLHGEALDRARVAIAKARGQE